MWKCKKVTSSLGLRYQVRCSETSTNCTVRARSTNWHRAVEKKSTLQSLDRQTFEKPFFFHEASQRSFWIPWRPSEMLELRQVSLEPETFVSVSEWKIEMLDQRFPSSDPDLLICGVTDYLLLHAVLLPGNAASSLCYNVLPVLRLFWPTFDLLHMRPSAKGSKSLNANQSGRSRNSRVEMRVGILTRNFHQGLGLRGF